MDNYNYSEVLQKDIKLKTKNQVYITFKVNGHLQKIRKVYMYELVKEIEDFLYYFTKEEQGIQAKTKNININIKPIISDLASEDCFQTFQQVRNLQNYQLLKAQISLFSSEEEIFSFIQTQKTLAHNQQEELTTLLFNALKIAQQLTKFHQINQIKNINLAKFSQEVYTKEKLEDIQENCLKVLERVKQQRRKSQLCSICWHKYSNTIFIPCMHLVSCQNCSQIIERCPICKVVILKKSLVYR